MCVWVFFFFYVCFPPPSFLSFVFVARAAPGKFRFFCNLLFWSRACPPRPGAGLRAQVRSSGPGRSRGCPLLLWHGCRHWDWLLLFCIFPSSCLSRWNGALCGTLPFGLVLLCMLLSPLVFLLDFFFFLWWCVFCFLCSLLFQALPSVELSASHLCTLADDGILCRDF